jgi:hypothetical protein
MVANTTMALQKDFKNGTIGQYHLSKVKMFLKVSISNQKVQNPVPKVNRKV